MTQPDVDDALRAAAQVGEFFAVAAHRTNDGGWFPLRDLTCSPGAVERRVAQVRRDLARSSNVPRADVPRRTTASVDLLSLSARLLSPVLGACSVAAVVPAFTLDNVLYEHGSQRLAVTRPSGRSVTTTQHAAEALDVDVLGPVVAPVVSAYAARFRMSTKVLWGNVASALNGAVEVLDASGVEQQLPARAIVTALLRTGTLRGTVYAMTPQFVRNSCCLWYRIPGSSVCGDCVLSA